MNYHKLAVMMCQCWWSKTCTTG